MSLSLNDSSMPRLHIKPASLTAFKKGFFLSCIQCLLLHFCYSVDAQYSWQKLSFPSVAQVKASFKKPPSYSSNSVTWGWNGPMSSEVIARDLDSLHALGFSAVTIEAGYRMPAEYLSDGWFKLVKMGVEEAKKRDMHVWIIDEGKYPSGFAGGKFSKERPDLRMQALVVNERISAGTGQAISKKLPATVVSAVAVNLADSSSQIIDVRSGEINWTAPNGNWQILLVQPQFKTAVTRAANNPTGGKDTTNSLCDYLSPVAVKQFIDFTHEQYKKYIGDEFGKTVLGFRGDEPEYAYTPWTPTILQVFRQRKGYDIQPYLASFFIRNMTGEQKRAKADYWDVWSDLFGETFFKLQGDWCAKNNLEYMVHLDHDDAMIGLAKSEGDFFKDFRSVQIPGIDVIWHQVWPGLVADFPKFASSAAHLFGRPRALSESFAAMTPAPDIEQARWIVNQQLVRGINLFEFMYFMSSSEGKGGARGYMADTLFPSLMSYTNRASYLLAQGKPAAQIAVYFPTTSLWLGHNESEKSGFDIARQLLESQHDFDFIDEYSLTNARMGKGIIANKSGQEYKAVIIPSINTMSSVAHHNLIQMSMQGMKLIFTDHRTRMMLTGRNFMQADTLPQIVDVFRQGNRLITSDKQLISVGKNFNWPDTLHRGKDNLQFFNGSSRYSFSALPADVKPDQPAPALKYLHRLWKDADLYFFFNESDQQLNRNITVNGAGEVQEWNAANGNIQKLKATGGNGSEQLTLELKPYETKFIVIAH